MRTDRLTDEQRIGLKIITEYFKSNRPLISKSEYALLIEYTKYANNAFLYVNPKNRKTLNVIREIYNIHKRFNKK